MCINSNSNDNNDSIIDNNNNDESYKENIVRNNTTTATSMISTTPAIVASTKAATETSIMRTNNVNNCENNNNNNYINDSDCNKGNEVTKYDYCYNDISSNSKSNKKWQRIQNINMDDDNNVTESSGDRDSVKKQNVTLVIQQQL